MFPHKDAQQSKLLVCGEGMVGENNYLLLWEKNEIEELNDDYETQEFLNNIILIGSDGGDMAYGIDISGKYIKVPFIGMDDEEVKIIAEDFDGIAPFSMSSNGKDKDLATKQGNRRLQATVYSGTKL